MSIPGVSCKKESKSTGNLSPILTSLYGFITEGKLTSSISTREMHCTFFSPIIRFSSLALIFFRLTVCWLKLIDRNLFIYISISFSFNSLALIPLLANSPNTFVMFLIKVSNLRGSKEKNLDLSTSPVITR